MSDLSGKLDTLGRWVEGLRQRTGALAPPLEGSRPPDFDQVRKLLEELRAAGEELGRQNEELTRAREAAEAVEAWRESEARLRAILDSAFSAILILRGNGVVDSFNPAAERIFGRPAAGVIGCQVSAVLPSLSIDPGGRLVASPDGVPQAVLGLGHEVAGLRPDGSTFPVDVSVSEMRLGRHRFFVIVARDITERKRAEESLRESELRFRTLVESAECLIVTARPDFTLLYFGPFAERLTGYPAEEVLGRDVRPLFLPAEHWQQEAEREMGRILAGRPTRGFECPLVCKDGSRRWVVWNSQFLPEYQGGPAVLSVGQDITGLKDAQDRALRSERLAGIGQMVAGLAHESGNALQRGQAALERLALRTRGQPELHDLVAEIQKAQDRLHWLHEQVRTYAGPVVLELKLCNLADVWRAAWANLEHRRRGRDATLEEETNDLETDWLVDPFRLEIVFRNLLDNSLAACADPVRITLRCSETQLDRGPAVRIDVCDNGPGLDAEQRQKIFEPFYTTKTKGTGLGMAIARRIVEAHGGRITVGEARCPGAEIQITLPRRER